MGEVEQEARDRVRAEGRYLLFSHGGAGVEESLQRAAIIARVSSVVIGVVK